MRADARRNRQRIMSSGRELFALQGEHAQMDEIAAHAGVGVGTLYRHFPDKQALLVAMVRERFEEFCEIAAEAEQIADPFASVDAALRVSLAAVEGDAGFQVALMRSSALHWEGIDEQKAVLAAIFTRILERAQAAGVVRSDLTFDDVPMILTGIISTMHFKPSTADWQRHLQLVLAGLRAQPQ